MRVLDGRLLVTPRSGCTITSSGEDGQTGWITWPGRSAVSSPPRSSQSPTSWWRPALRMINWLWRWGTMMARDVPRTGWRCPPGRLLKTSVRASLERSVPISKWPQQPRSGPLVQTMPASAYLTSSWTMSTKKGRWAGPSSAGLTRKDFTRFTIKKLFPFHSLVVKCLMQNTFKNRKYSRNVNI